jgi:enterochelin esterase-like enzyme
VGLRSAGLLGLGAILVVAAIVTSLGSAEPPPLAENIGTPIRGFSLLALGPDGGTAWQGVIPNSFVREDRRPSVLYLPPGYSTRHRYPVVYLLHGLPGSPYSYVFGLRLVQIADRLIATRVARPFVAVMPVAGKTSRYGGEWAGPWERYVVSDVVEWTDAHLPAERGAKGRTLAGLSAGGFGAVDIGLRHPRMFATLEAWSGYFSPPRDGPFKGASGAVLREHDPVLLVRREARELRRAGTRMLLSVGTTDDRWTAARTRAFGAELRRLGIDHRLLLEPGGHNHRFWRRQLPAALTYAVATRPPAPAAVPGPQ